MNQERKGGSALFLRCVLCLIGMFLYACGVILTKNCDLGISPITSVAYAMSLISGISLGWCTSLFNIALFILQKALLRSQYTWRTLLAQAGMSILFSIFIDSAGILLGGVCPSAYASRIVLFVFGCFVLAVGMNLILHAQFVILPAEGAVAAIQNKSGLSFGTTKIAFDAVMVLITSVLTIVFLHQLKGIREGTILAVVLIGNFSRLFARKRNVAKSTSPTELLKE